MRTTKSSRAVEIISTSAHCAFTTLLPGTTCSNCDDAAATVSCEHCGLLCHPCSSQLHAMKALSWHTPSHLSSSETETAPMSAATSAPGTTTASCMSETHKKPRCAAHNKKLDLFCVKDEVAVCAHCMLLGPHRDPATGTPHACESLDQAAQRLRRKMDDERALLSKLGDAVCAGRNRLLLSQRRIDERCEAVKIDVYKSFSELRAEIGETERRLISEIETFNCEKAANIRKSIEELDALSGPIERSQLELKTVDLLPSLPFLQAFGTHVTPFRTLQVPTEEPIEEIEFSAARVQAVTQQIASLSVITTGFSIKHSSFSVSPQQCNICIGDRTAIEVTPSLCDIDGRACDKAMASKIGLQLHAFFINEPNEQAVKVNGLSVEVGPFAKSGHHKLSLQLHPFSTPVVVPLNVVSLIAIGKSNATYPGYRMMTLIDLTEEPMKTKIFDAANANGGGLLSLDSFKPSDVCQIQEGYVQFGGSCKFLQATETFREGDTQPAGKWNACYLYSNTGRNFSQLRKECGQACVIDCGTGLTKVGLSIDGVENGLPRGLFPTIIGRLRPALCTGFGVPEYCGNEALQKPQGHLFFKHPVERGVVNLYEIESIYTHIFNSVLRIASDEHSILIAEPSLNPNASSEKLIQILFETFTAPAAYLANDALLSLISSGRTTGIVIDCGEGITRFAPIIDGTLTTSATARVELAGCDLTDFMSTILSQHGNSLSESISDRAIVKDIKEHIPYVALNFDEEMGADPPQSKKTCQLPDKRVINLPDKLFRCPEALFRPELIGKKTPGIHQFCATSISQCDASIHPQLYGNIILCGGSSMFPGMQERLQKEISISAPSHSTKVIATPDRRYSVWLGGCIVASHSTFEQMCISKAEYDDYGPGIVNSKC
ncbi:actin beta/gamma 1 [Pelomyxa schiedti]|nr:actin beta/gamma 1 [Pelomyxa schiedti]